MEPDPAMAARDHHHAGHGTAGRRGLTSRTRALAALIATVALVGATLVAASGTAVAARSTASYERGLLAQVNNVRTARGLERVRLRACVDRAAERAVVRTSRGRGPALRARALKRRCGVSLTGRSVRTTRVAPRRLVRTLVRRPAGRRALLSRDATTIGVGAVHDGRRWYVVLVLATGRTGTSGAGSGSTDSDATDPGATGGGATSDPDTVTPDPDTVIPDPDTVTPDPGTVTDGVTASDSLTQLADAILEETNRRRAQHDLGPLLASSCAESFAEQHSATLAKTGVLAHADLSALEKECAARGFAENVAALTGTALDPVMLVNLWMGSPQHRANILNAGLTHLGVGVAHDAETARWYITQDFLTRD